MRSILILAVFGILLLQLGISSAETFAECQTKCSMELSSGATNCPPPGNETRIQCLQEIQETMTRCIDSCPPAAPADAPKEVPAVTPSTDTPKDN
jgi:hypothetical protein